MFARQKHDLRNVIKAHRPLVVMLILSFTLSELLMVLYVYFILFEEILEKLSLIFNILLILEDKACVYEHLSLLELSVKILLLFWKNFNFFRVSLLSLDGIEDRTLEISALWPTTVSCVINC